MYEDENYLGGTIMNERLQKYFKENGTEKPCIINLVDGTTCDEDNLQPNVLLEYFYAYDIYSRIGYVANVTDDTTVDDIIDVEDERTRLLITIELLQNGKWVEVRHEFNKLDDVIDEYFKDGEIIRLTDLSGKHEVLDPDLGLNDPNGIYIVGYSPDQYFEGINNMLNDKMYIDDDDDDDEEDTELSDYVQAGGIRLIPATHLVEYIRKYSCIADVAKLIRIEDDAEEECSCGHHHSH